MRDFNPGGYDTTAIYCKIPCILFPKRNQTVRI